jgi:hypothetical protein
MLGNTASSSFVPQFNFPRATNVSSCFSGTGLRVLPKINAPSATDVGSMFSGSALTYIESISFGSVTSANSVFGGASALTILPIIDLTSVAAAVSSFATNINIRSGYTTGMKYGHSYQNCKLAAAELNTIYTNLGTAVGAQTITVTGNWGTATDDTSIATGKGWTVSG